MKPTPISWGHQKAVNWLDIEQQLFYSNCPLYLHPVPVPGVYNGSMYPKCLYPDQPAATRSKDLFFPSAGLPEESSPIRNLFSPQRRIMKKQRSLAHSAHVRALECRKDGTSTKCRREAISVVISLLQQLLELHGDFPDSFPGTASWNANVEKLRLAQGRMCTRIHTQSL